MKAFHELQIQEVKTIIGRYGEVDAINGFLKQGWVLLDLYNEAFIFDEEHKIYSQRPCYVLGRSTHPDFQQKKDLQEQTSVPLERLDVAEDEELDVDTIIRLAGKKPGLKPFGEDFDADF